MISLGSSQMAQVKNAGMEPQWSCYYLSELVKRGVCMQSSESVSGSWGGVGKWRGRRWTSCWHLRHHRAICPTSLSFGWGASRRSALKWGGQLTTAGLRGDRTRSSGSHMQGSRGTEGGGRRGCAGLHALRGWSEEFTYSRPPGWLGPSWWAPWPPGPAWPKSTGLSCDARGPPEGASPL